MAARGRVAARSLGQLRSICGEAAAASGGEASQAIDVHSHVYLPRYMRMLRERTAVPRIIDASGEDRLVILPGEDEESSTSAGRPIGTEYSDMARKLRFMDQHGIAASVLSLANPWIDFLSREEAVPLATELNDEMQHICEESSGRFYGFGVIPVAQDPEASAEELHRIAKLDKMRGIILGTSGRGKVRCAPDPAAGAMAGALTPVSGGGRAWTTQSWTPCGRRARGRATWSSSTPTTASAPSISAAPATPCS